MKKLFTLLLLLSSELLFANDTIPETKFSFKFGGRIDVNLFYDSYQSIESRGGLMYKFPDKPAYNKDGDDVNFRPWLRFGIASSRVNFAATATNVLGATVRGFIEVDFMGTADNVLSTIRLRHAYVDMKWKNRALLVGQTSHLTMVDQVAANTVTFGGGYSINPLNRPVQVQFTQNLGRYSNLTLAAAIFGGVTGDRQSYALMPDIQLRYTGGNADTFTYGLVVGMRSEKPRTLTADSTLTSEKILSFNAAIFARYTFGGGYAAKIFGLWGGDLSPLSILGGYAPLYEDRNKVDYGYAPLRAFSAFLDVESPLYCKSWQWGIFGGWQQNLGSAQMIDLSQATIANKGINYYWRVAPRVYYNYKKHLTFGLEYMLSGAQWAKEMDNYYMPISNYETTYNSRVTFLARFKF